MDRWSQVLHEKHAGEEMRCDCTIRGALPWACSSPKRVFECVRARSIHLERKAVQLASRAENGTRARRWRRSTLVREGSHYPQLRQVSYC
jgi:hypothetical protein